MRFLMSARTDVGRKRPHNEDTLKVDESLGLYIVCDGMGGHAAGEVASAMAAETVHTQVSKVIEEMRRAAMADDRDSRRRVLDLLGAAVTEANRAIHERAEANPEQRGMGTTLSLLFLAAGRAYVAHVGDSRLYLLRNDQVHQVTADHTILNEMIRAGRIKPEDRNKVRHMNALTRAVGVYPNVEVDTLELDVLPGDVFLLCSDGLHNYFEDFDLAGFLQHSEPESVTDDLIAYANKCGGSDNITVCTIFVKDAHETEKTMRIRLTLKTLRQIPLFQYLSFSELLKLIQICRLVEVSEGTPIIRENDPGEALFVVVDGRAVVHRGEQEISVLNPGRHFGEIALIDNRPRSASVTATKDSLLIRVTRDDFYELLREDSVLAVKLLWNFIQTLTAVIRDLNDLPGPEKTLGGVAHPYTSQGFGGDAE